MIETKACPYCKTQCGVDQAAINGLIPVDGDGCEFCRPLDAEWQVQIWHSDVEEWYGWAHTDYDASSKTDAERAAKIARQRG